MPDDRKNGVSVNGATGGGHHPVVPPEVGDPATEITPVLAERTDARTLEMLVCPVCKSTLEYAPGTQELISRRANLAYPIRSGVPLLTREAARTLD